MRNLSLIMLFIISTSCSTHTVEENNFESKQITKKNSMLTADVSNEANPYDYAGASYLLLLDNYKAYYPKPSSSPETMELLETIGGNLGILNTGYVQENLQNITVLQQLAIDDLNLAIAQSGLSTLAQTMLSNCITGLIQLKEQDAAYDEAYAYLVGFESSVEASSFSANEKAILLSTLSIVRYDIYNTSAREGKDRDWELSVGNFVATVYGAVQSIPNAIISAGISSIN